MVEPPPCPKCGSKDLRTKVTTDEGATFRCDGCGADFFVAEKDLEVVAIAYYGVEAVTDYLSHEES